MRRMVWAFVAGAAVIWHMPEPVYAQVETSLRPQIRPTVPSNIAARQAPQAGVILAASIRPVLRPSGLSTRPAEAATQVSVQDPKFGAWIAGFKGRARAAGISGDVFDRAFRGVQFDPSVIKLDRNQSEFTKEIWDYLDFAVAPTRVTNGKKMLRRHGRTLDRIEAQFGVEKEVVTAIWGMESAYGERRGDRPLIESLATLAYDGRRGEFFEKQLIAALKIIQAGDVAPGNMTGSWAGAMGHTQFIPTSYEAYAVDFTGDGKRDIWSDDPTDALASTAAYLKRFGWKKGQPWGVEVKLPSGFDLGRARREFKQNPGAWAAEGVRDMNGKAVPNYGAASILLPAGSEGAAFMIFNNFAVIERYNQADAYVIGVGHLSDRITGGPAIQASWPRQHAPTSIKEKEEIQRRLRRKGFAVEKIDGVVGPNTIAAIRAFQQSRGIPADGFPSQELLQQLRGQ